MTKTFNKGDIIQCPESAPYEEWRGAQLEVLETSSWSGLVRAKLLHDIEGENNPQPKGFIADLVPEPLILVKAARPATVTPIKSPGGTLAIVDEVTEDVVNNPSHYTQYPHEVIEFTEHMDFCKGNAVKYIARAGFKGGPEKEIEDLEKAKWYIDRKIKFLQAAK